MKVRFRRFTVDEARTLLAGRHIAIVGDSVICYTYLAMAHFLHSGDDMRIWNATQRGHGSPLGEMLWRFNFGRGKKATSSETWMEYYRVTSGDFNGAEICDCLRESCHPWCSTFIQNRYFRFGSGDRLGRVTYIPSFNKLPQKWHEVDFANWRLNCRIPLKGMEGRMCDSLHEKPHLPTAPSDAPGREWRYARMRRVLAAFQPMDVILWNAITNWEKPADDEKHSARALVINNVTVTSAVEPDSLCRFASAFATSTPKSSTKMLWNQLTSGMWSDIAGRRKMVLPPPTRLTTAALGRKFQLPAPAANCQLPRSHRVFEILSHMVTRLYVESGLTFKEIVMDSGAHYQGWVYHELVQLWLNAVEDMLPADMGTMAGGSVHPPPLAA